MKQIGIYFLGGLSMKNIANDAYQPQTSEECCRKIRRERKQREKQQEEKTKRSSPAISNPRPEKLAFILWLE